MLEVMLYKSHYCTLRESSFTWSCMKLLWGTLLSCCRVLCEAQRGFKKLYIMLLVLNEGNINGSFNCIFIMCLNKSTAFWLVLVNIHMVAWGCGFWGKLHGYISCYSIYMNDCCTYYLQY